MINKIFSHSRQGIPLKGGKEEKGGREGGWLIVGGLGV